jgi:hypothetical protein
MLFWLHWTRREMVAKGQDIPPLKLIFLPILLLAGVAFLQFFVHLILASNDSGGLETSQPITVIIINISSVLLGLTAIFVCIPLALYWFYKYCRAAEVITKGELSFELSYILLIILSFFSCTFVWPGIVQDSFNKIGSKKS